MNERFRFTVGSTEDTMLDQELSKIIMEKLVVRGEATGDERRTFDRSKEGQLSDQDRHRSPLSTQRQSHTRSSTQSPIKRSRRETQHDEFAKVDDLINRLSETELKRSNTKNCDMRQQYESSVEDMKKVLRQLRITPIECPSIALDPDISSPNYVRLIKHNQHLQRLMFEKNQDIEMINFMLNVFLASFESNSVPSKDCVSMMEPHTGMYYEEGSYVTATHQIPTTSTIEASRDFRDRRQYLTPERDVHTEEFDRTSSFELDKENVSTPVNQYKYPVKSSLQKLFKSHEETQDERLKRINENVLLD